VQQGGEVGEINRRQEAQPHSVSAWRVLHKNRGRCARNAPKQGFDESVVEPLRQRQL
jgi:hypothetical protein